MAREINLVPDIKEEMIRTLKLRNFIYFICLVVAGASVAVTFLAGIVAGGQQWMLSSRQTTISNLSAKLNSYSDLEDFITIKNQLNDISTITNNKKVLSRTFNILSTLIPTGPDTITISELSVNLSSDQPNISFDAQANAGVAPFYDYRVLDSFQKSMDYMRYDYGSYVDKEGNTIPAYCIIESGLDGATFRDSEKGIYALWTINGEGCNPSTTLTPESYSTEDYEDQQVVRIWRTPQFTDWYKENPANGEPSISLDGTISNVQHFNSACITYSGDDSQNSASPKWTETNNDCKLVSGGSDGIKVGDSSNGRGADNDLVLRFSATIQIAPEVYKFTNTHVLAIAPSGRYNVTDSYVQVQAMFGKRAADCAENDTDCKNNTNNSGATNNTENETKDETETNKETNGGA